jgi:hypothetical protein
VSPGLLLFFIVLILPAVLHGVASAGERRVTERRWLALPEERGDEARRGYKTAQVLVAADGTSATLAGITVGGRYKAEDRAHCANRGCEPPGLDCACGFYAFTSRAEAVELLRETLACNGLRDKALLTVELDGTVLQYERGYRGERQRVLGVQFERQCAGCRREGVGRPATHLAADSAFRLPTIARYVSPSVAASRGLLPVRPVCDEHLPMGAVVLGLPEVAGLLGTEVTWLP